MARPVQGGSNGTWGTELDASLDQLAINVKNYATGDGVTDDTAQLQAAADAITAAGGGTLYFPAGTYLVSTAIYISSGTIVQGAGRFATTVKRKNNSFVAASTASNLSTHSCFAAGPSVGTIYTVSSRGSFISLRDITLDGNKANQTYTGIVNTNYAGAHGFGCRFVDYVEVSGCRIQNTAQNGLLYAGCGEVYTHHNAFLNCGSSDSAFAALTKNAISHNGNNTTDVGYTTVFNCCDNYFNGSQDEAIQFGFAQDVVISRNHMYTSGDKAIEGDSAFAGTGPGDVIISDNFVRTTGAEGIGVANADGQDVTIRGNHVIGAAHTAIIATQSNESSFLITENTIKTVAGGYGGAGGYAGINVASGHKVTVANNKLYDCGGDAITVLLARNLSVAGNTIEKVTGRAIAITMSTATTVDNISIANNILDTIDAVNPVYLNANGQILNCSIIGNIGYNLGKTGSSSGSTSAFRVDGASTTVRALSFVGNITSDRRGTQVLGICLDLTGSSSVTEFVADGNYHNGALAAISAVGQISTAAVISPANRWEGPAGTRTTTGNRSLLITDSIVLSSGGTLTHTLPPVVPASRGRAYTIRNIHASSACTVQPASGNVDGVASVAISAGSAMRFASDGTNWWSV